MQKNILILGSGGREHALAWKIAQSPKVGHVFIAPGNGGTESLGTNVSIPLNDFQALITFAKKENVYLTIVGPDDLLAQGVVDAFKKAGLLIFGPTQEEARIESSKSFAKEFMQASGLPTAKYQTFKSFSEAESYISTSSLPLVIKASGLALGKGVFICSTQEEARKVAQDLLVNKKLGQAGEEVIIEEFLEGPEISAHALVSGKNWINFPFAQDHKRIGEGNTGPNTGGMGSFTPVPWVTSKQKAAVDSDILTPLKKQLREKFSGCLFPGLLMTKTGPKILEFNARFGDPETQSYLRLLKSDLFDLIEGVVLDTVSQVEVEWNPGYAACVVVASAGYPGEYQKGKPITGIEEAEKIPGVVVFQAGTKRKNADLVTNGGRVLAVSGVGTTLKKALATAYSGIQKISFEGAYYRRDIGASVSSQSSWF
jgi:phosphoribosylamine--glycine ligase